MIERLPLTNPYDFAEWPKPQLEHRLQVDVEGAHILSRGEGPSPIEQRVRRRIEHIIFELAWRHTDELEPAGLGEKETSHGN